VNYHARASGPRTATANAGQGLADKLTAQARPRPGEILGRVLDGLGRPLASVTVYAVAEGQVRSAGVTNSDGEFRMEVTDGQPLTFGALSSEGALRILGVAEGPTRVVILTVGPDVETRTVAREAESAMGGAPVQAVASKASPDAPVLASVGVLQGAVFDQTGAPLPGVRVTAIDQRGGIAVAVTITGADGRFALFVPTGAYVVVASSPGLEVATKHVDAAGKVRFVLAVKTAPETIVVSGRSVLSFKMSDSIWPEYVPPPEAAAWLRFAYGIEGEFYRCDTVVARPPNPNLLSTRYIRPEQTRDDPSLNSWNDCPLSVWVQKKGLAPFWWLSLLQISPSVARLATPEVSDGQEYPISLRPFGESK
jgi:hypothetical protein